MRARLPSDGRRQQGRPRLRLHARGRPEHLKRVLPLLGARIYGDVHTGHLQDPVLEYNDHDTLYLTDDDTIQSEAGKHQGEPLANLKYASFDKMVNDLITELRSLAKMLLPLRMGAVYI